MPLRPRDIAFDRNILRAGSRRNGQQGQHAEEHHGFESRHFVPHDQMNAGTL
ncbi:hypothetical protein EEB18_019520 [Sphingopyxis sp. OPL5]|uniref:hypothetical protein n=1 Tax=Sphingopyxis sp. OPL5 TaxID=2486273 RepID=UPI001657069F|nr:hypothetical protein [Sphingopyxis sp. OPL5]QNO26879.1 hypothetical protein EEB18_019520 [Sphingopyxis sp. OPL5]